jgi:hypothetical protein
MIITLLRKPLEGSVADNALKHGCGAINIDGTRVGTEARSYKGAGKTDKVYSESGAGMLDGRGKDMEFSVEGRWPANFILTHLDGCEIKGTKKVKSGTAYQDKRAGINHVYSANLGPNVKGKAGYADEEGKEEVADWACVEGCPVIELDQQSGHLKSTTRKPTGNPIYPTSNTSVTWNPNNVMDTSQRGFNDEGGASRFFKQF